MRRREVGVQYEGPLGRLDSLLGEIRLLGVRAGDVSEVKASAREMPRDLGIIRVGQILPADLLEVLLQFNDGVVCIDVLGDYLAIDCQKCKNEPCEGDLAKMGYP